MVRWIIRATVALTILIGGVIVFAIAGAVVAGNASVGGTLGNGRTVSAGGNTPMIGLETTQDSAIITTILHKVIVAPTFITVDGKFGGTILASAKNVEVRFEWTGIDVFADGATVDANPVSSAAAQTPVVR
jgi:hypothetical protein